MRRRTLLAAWPLTGSALGLGLGAAAHAKAIDENPAAIRLPLGVAPRELRFPPDFGAHPETRIEWWYVTGWLGPSMSAPTHGFQVTFFRAATGLAAGHPSAFAAQQLLFAHAALTVLPTAAVQNPAEPTSGRLIHDQRSARAGLGRAEARTRDTAVHLGDWSLSRVPGPGSVNAAAAAAAAAASDTYRAVVHARDPQTGVTAYRLTLDLRPQTPIVLQGDRGYSRKGPRPEQASHYYSRPQLQVGAELSLARGAPQSLSGRAWLDHEWSDSVLDPEAVGWDWVGFNLGDGGALTAFRLRRADGSALWAGGSFQSANGTTAPAFGPDAVRFTPLRVWTSPLTGARYPVEWQLDTPAGRHRVRALLDAQELDSRASTGSAYWEGLSELLDADGRRVGLGYLELTGYVGRLAMP